MGHDAWDRVVAVAHFKNGSPFASVSFTFDRDGNIRQGSETRIYDPATTRMTVRAGYGYYHDRAGNLDSAHQGGTEWGGRRYIYDALDRLITVRENGVTLARYAYDVLGRRIVKRVYSGANAGYLRMVYRGSGVAVEADSAGALTLGYTSGLGVDNLVAVHKYSDGSDYYVVQDALHSVRGLSRRDGTWMASWRYGIYGAVLDTAGAAPLALRYRWTGREYDVETGFYYFRARFYDPAAQRFVQEDPIGFAGGANLYAYGDGNPTNGRDPDGLRMDPAAYIPERGTFDPRWGGKDLYIDGAYVGSVGGYDLSSNMGKFANTDWSPRTTLERRAIAIAVFNLVGAIEAALNDGTYVPKSGDVVALGLHARDFIDGEGHFKIGARIVTDLIYHIETTPNGLSITPWGRTEFHLGLDLDPATILSDPSIAWYHGKMLASNRWYDVQARVNERGFALIWVHGIVW